jgi:hypothetical protein
MDIRELIGKRCLVKGTSGFRSSGIQELKILEVSPSGNWVKAMNIDGRKFWQMVSDIAFVEVLVDFKASREPKPADDESNPYANPHSGIGAFKKDSQ